MAQVHCQALWLGVLLNAERAGRPARHAAAASARRQRGPAAHADKDADELTGWPVHHKPGLPNTTTTQ